MLTKCIVMLLCLTLFAVIPCPSFSAGPTTVKDGVLTLPPGGYIEFFDGTTLNSASRLEGGITANADLKVCTGTMNCMCDAGKVVKALLAVTCAYPNAMNRSALIDASATGWTAACLQMQIKYKDINTDPNPHIPFMMVEDIYVTEVAPQNIVIGCTTP
jgi:hypothetical protein